MERRRFVVIGLGSFGHHLARSLYEMGHDVLGIDRDPSAVEAIRPHCSRAQLADVSDKEELEAVGVEGADVGVVGLGTRMDASILATLFLKELGVKEIVAKAISLDHGRILERIGATEVVHPERDVAKQLAQRMSEPGILEKIPFLEGFALIEIRAPASLWGKTLSDSQLRRAHRLAVVLLKRWEEDRETSIPARPDEKILEGDVMVVLARTEDVVSFRKANPD